MKISCICTSSEKNSLTDLIPCSNCAYYSHLSCYHLTPHSLSTLSTPFLCFICRLVLNDPFIELTDIICKPYMLPQKKHIEQYQKFELTYPQSNDIRSGMKNLKFAVFKANPRVLELVWPAENLFFWVNSKTVDFDKKSYGEISGKVLRSCNEFCVCCLEGLSESAVFIMFLTRKMEIPRILTMISQRSLFKDYENYRMHFQNKIKDQQHERYFK